MRTCIYCLEPEPTVSFQKTAHVIPQSFGKFQENITANGMECDKCNQFFGDNPELVLGRDTLEGHLRVTYGIKKPDDFKSIGPDTRLIVHAPCGRYKGAPMRLVYREGSTSPTLDQIPSVGISRRNTEERAWFVPADIPRREDLDPEMYDLENNEACVILSDKPAEIVAILMDKGYKFNEGATINSKEPHEEFDTSIQVRIDPPAMRAACKIAFSYLAAVHGGELARHSRFDPIRRFIRFGEGLSPQFVTPSQDKILADEPVNGCVRRAHLLTVHFEPHEKCLVGQLSLFNSLKYTVTFAHDCEDLAQLEAKGSCFNLADMCILPLIASLQNGVVVWNV